MLGIHRPVIYWHPPPLRLGTPIKPQLTRTGLWALCHPLHPPTTRGQGTAWQSKLSQPAGGLRCRESTDLEGPACVLQNHPAPAATGPISIGSPHEVAVSYICNQGGTKGLALFKIDAERFWWAEQNLLSLTASYLPGVENSLADGQSGHFLERNEWSLIRRYLQMIFLNVGDQDINLMATASNRRLLGFF